MNLNLRHLLVVDVHNNVVGIITRKDLDHAAGHGWWRMSHVAEAPNKKGVMSKITNSGFFKHFGIGVGSHDDEEAAHGGAGPHGQAHGNGQQHGH